MHRIQSLETALNGCRLELRDEKEKLSELKEHFKYNLKLINDRDSELQRYDALFLGNLNTLSACSLVSRTLLNSPKNLICFLHWC